MLTEAHVELAKTLRLKAEHLDPTGHWDVDWNDLPEREREFYRLCIRAILNEGELVRRALITL